MPRSAVVIALPRDEFVALSGQLTEAGYEPIEIGSSGELEHILSVRRDVGVAVLDGEKDFDRTLEMYTLLHEAERDIPALMVVSPRALDRLSLAGRARESDEYFTRPYSPESLRWRIEAMLIRSQTSGDEATGSIIEAEPEDAPAAQRGTVVVVFNPKGGVGKTTIAINLAAALSLRKQQHVLLIDADIVTGHIASSLGMEHLRTVVDAWTEDSEGDGLETFVDIASVHQNGVSVMVMAESPLHTQALEPDRVIDQLNVARRSYDWIIVDMHPDYGSLNQLIFERADRIIVPVTPDVPAIRAAVQFREVAVELNIRERLAMVVNRANSGVSVADMERTVGMPSLAEIRSGGLLFVRAANEGRSAVERFPKEKVIDDIETLASRLLSAQTRAPARTGLLSLFGRRDASATKLRVS